MSLFKGIKDQSSQGSGDYLGPGIHRLKLIKAITKTTRKRADAVIFNVEVLESSNTRYAKGAKSTIFITAKVDTGWLGDCKNVAIALLGSRFGEAVGEDAVDEEVMDAMTAGDGTMMAGAIFKCDAFEVPTKGGGKFTKYVCEPVFA